MSKKLVVIENNQPVPDSRTVADKFSKNHRDVLKAIRELISQTGDMRKIRRCSSRQHCPTNMDANSPLIS